MNTLVTDWGHDEIHGRRVQAIEITKKYQLYQWYSYLQTQKCRSWRPLAGRDLQIMVATPATWNTVVTGLLVICSAYTHKHTHKSKRLPPLLTNLRRRRQLLITSMLKASLGQWLLRNCTMVIPARARLNLRLSSTCEPSLNLECRNCPCTAPAPEIPPPQWQHTYRTSIPP